MASNVCKYLSLIAADLLITFGLHGAAKSSASVCLSQLWIMAVIRWLFLGMIFPACLRINRNVILRRCAATMCLLCPVFETGAVILLARHPENWSGCLSSPVKTVVASIATGTACLFWEVRFPDGVGKVLGSSKDTEKKQKARALFIRVIRYSRPDAPFLGGAFLFLALAVLCEMFIPFYTGKVIDILGTHYYASEFQYAILFMGLFSLGSSLSSGLRGGLFMCMLSRLNKRLRIILFQALVKQEIGFFENTKTGDLTSRLSMDTKLMSQSVAMNVNILLRGVIKTVGVLFLMVNLSWKLTLVAFIEAPLIAITQTIYNTYYEQLSKEVQDSMALGNEVVGEGVAAVRTVRSFRSEGSEGRRYSNRLLQIHKLKIRRDTVRAIYVFVRRLMALGMQVLMLHYGRQLIRSNKMTTGNLVSFILYQEHLESYIMSVVHMYSNMLNSVGAAAKVFEYLDREPLVSTKGVLEPDHLTGHVQFQNLTFSYPTRQDTPTLKDFCLELLPGKLTALVGPSGGGKSTCVSLLERFYQPQEGEILMDGRPLQNYKHSYLHRKVAMVGQEPVLFAGSVRDNISYGLEDCPLEEVQEAARRANAHNFICQLEKGYDTDVGERGGLLSGGQKQRIAIARALIRDPQVLILDEVTSALDTESEHMVQQTLASCPSQTLLVIAHRLKTIEEADHIVVIGEGKVQEQGTHQELMDRKGTYHQLREMAFTKVKGEPIGQVFQEKK